MDRKLGTDSRERDTEKDQKGVTATPYDIQGLEGGQSNSEDLPQKDGVEAVKIDLKSVIDGMGPHTPHLTQRTNSEADVEESYSRPHKIKNPDRHFSLVNPSTVESETVEDISEMSTLISDSVGVESYSKECTSSWSESSAVQHHLKTCPCRTYVKSGATGLTAGDDKYRSTYKQPVITNLAFSNARRPLKGPRLPEMTSKRKDFVQQTHTAGSYAKNFEYQEVFKQSGSENLNTNLMDLNPKFIPNRPNPGQASKMLGVFSKMFPQSPLSENYRKNSKDKAMMMLSNLFRFKRPSFTKDPLELYKVNIAQNAEQTPPKKIVFELIEDLPKPDTNTVATNTMKAQSTRRNGVQVNTFPNSHNSFYPAQAQQNYSFFNDKQSYSFFNNKQSCSQNFMNEKPFQESSQLSAGEVPTKVDVYYFDHGNASYYRTTDQTPVLMTEVVAERTENYTMRFWAQFYGTIHIGFAFFTSFILQTLRFILQSLFRPLCIGLVQLGSDYFFKPLLAVLFNAVLQPVLIFFYNVATSLRDLLDPVAEAIGYFLREVANIFRACRLIEVKKGNCTREPH